MNPLTIQRLGMIGIFAFMANTAGFCLAANPSPAPGKSKPGEAEATSDPADLTKPIPRSVFKDFDPYTMRDPFWPIGYQKPKPTIPGNGDPNTEVEKPPPPVPPLILKAILSSSAVITSTNQMLYVGTVYPYKGPDGNQIIYMREKQTFKFLRINNDDSITILYRGKEYNCKLPTINLNTDESGTKSSQEPDTKSYQE